MGHKEEEVDQVGLGSNLLECRPDTEAIDRLLREQGLIEDRKREEKSKNYILDQEATLLSGLLHQALTRVQELDSEIDATMSQIFERQKYNTAVEALYNEEGDKEKRMTETLTSMKTHRDEQLHLIDALGDHLIGKGVSIK